MRDDRYRLLRLPLAFAAAASAGAALACGPMGGMGGEDHHHGSTTSSPPPSSGGQDHHHSSGEGHHRHDSDAARRAREGADDAADDNLDDDGFVQRGGGGEESSDLTGAIERLADLKRRIAAQEEQDARAAALAKDTGYDGDTHRINPDWLVWHDQYWWNKLPSDDDDDGKEDNPEPSKYKDLVFPPTRPFYPQYTGAVPNPNNGLVYQPSTLNLPTPPPPTPDESRQFADRQAQLARDYDPDKGKNPAFLDWMNLPWYQRWFTDMPPEYPPRHDIKQPTGTAGVRG